jgi:hypothetical protein
MSNLALPIGAMYDTYGAVTATGQGSVLTFGSYTQITSSTTRDYDGIILNANFLFPESTLVTNCEITIDVAIGASGSEQILCDKLRLPQTYGDLSAWVSISTYLPIAVPRGSRIALRANGGPAVVPSGYGPFATIMAMAGAPLFNKGFRYAESMGISSNFGTVIPSTGDVGVYGAWTEIIASSLHNYAALMVAIGGNEGQFREATLLDIGYGVSGSEQQLFQAICSSFVNGINGIVYFGPYPVNMPAGTRFAARVCGYANTTPINGEPDVALYGFVR